MNVLMASVGRKAINRSNDVRLIQTLLNKQSIPGITDKLVVDGRVGPRTIQHIENFQRYIVKYSRPDGKVDPQGRTFQHLTKTSAASSRLRPINSISFSNAGIALLKSKESLSLTPYNDQTGEKISDWVEGATIGYGHLIEKSIWDQYKKGITQPQAEALLRNDLAPFVNTVRSTIRVDISQTQFDALVLLAFNIGSAAFARSSVAKLVNDRTAVTGYINLKAAWMAWTKSQGKEMKGLVNRRQSEWNLYERGVYQ